MSAALQRLCKWRVLFTGWQLGTRAKGDPEGDAVRDHREVTILLRAEVTALTKLCIDKKIFTVEEFNKGLDEEADMLNADYQRRFPGVRATDYGLDINVALARDTMKGWKP